MVTWRDGGFWQAWVAANVVGWALGLPVVGLLMIVAGTAQWWALRRHLPQPGHWLVATAGGWIAVILLLWPVVASDPLGRAPAANLLLCGLAGTILGAAQWLALRHYTRRAGWWVVASTLGSALCLPAYQLVWSAATVVAGPHAVVALTGLVPAAPASWVVWALQGAACGLVYAVPTGLAGGWLLGGGGVRVRYATQGQAQLAEDGR